MKNTLFASLAVLLLGSVSAAVAGPVSGLSLSAAADVPALHFVKDGGDDNGGSDDNGSDDNGGGNDDGSNHDANDDKGGLSGGGNDDGPNHDVNDDKGGLRSSNDDGDESGSNRRKPRIPGGSGCDDASDVAEHAECRSVMN